MSEAAEYAQVSDHDAPPAAVRERMTRVSVALLVALTLAVVVSAFGADGAAAPGGRLGGDLPAFYGAGRIAADGDWVSLYDADRQIAAQADLWEDAGDYLYFAYPPQVAAAYRLLVPLGYRGAYVAHTALMALALLAAVWMVRPVLPWLARFPLVVPFAFVLTFYPMLRSVLGGQNSSLTLLLLAAALRLDHDDRPLVSGVVAALLLYKPQFGIPVVLLLIAGRRWRALGGWGIGAAALYFGGAALFGFSWAGDWWSQATSFAELNADVNGVNFVSVPGFVQQVFGSTAGTAALVVAGAAGGLAAALVWFALADLPAVRYAAAAAVLVAIAPQALFYEAGVLLLPVALLATNDVAWRGRILGAGWLAGLLHLGARPLDASPLVLFVVAVAGFVLGMAAGPVRRRLSRV